jgi:hypothetical protein
MTDPDVERRRAEIDDELYERESLLEERGFALASMANEFAEKYVAQKEGPGLVVRRLSEIEREQVRWLWEPRIPLGKVTILAGDPDAGKSWLSLAVAVAVTRGVALPDSGEPPPMGDVVIAAYEDGAADTIKPRASELGVDESRVHVVEGTRDNDGHVRPFSAADVDALATYVEQIGAVRLVVIDPVASFIGGKVDAYRDNEVRDALNPLADPPISPEAPWPGRRDRFLAGCRAHSGLLGHIDDLDATVTA